MVWRFCQIKQDMTFDEFIKKYDQKGIDFDGAYGDQCMDLMHQYIYEVLGLTDRRVLAAPAAKDVYLNFESLVGHESFLKIPNTAGSIPQKGDIVLWGEGIGPYGHVAVYVDGDASKFVSFDQNYPTGSLCHKQNHNYHAVLGWLRSKNQTAESEDDITKKEVLALEYDAFYPGDPQGRDNWVQQKDQSGIQLLTLIKDEMLVGKYHENRADLEAEVNKLNGLLEEANNAKTKLTDANSTLQRELDECLADSGTHQPVDTGTKPPTETQPGAGNPPPIDVGDSSGGLSNADAGILKKIIEFLKKLFGGGG